MKKLYAIHTLFLSVFFLAFAGCDANEPEDPTDLTGSFEIEVSGAVTQTINGNQAAFGSATDTQTGITGFALGLGATGTASQGITFSRKGARPGNGSHAIANFDLTTDVDALSDDDIIAVYSSGADVFYSSGGTMTITESSTTRMEGTISFTAKSVLPMSTAEVTITGSFEAVGQDISGVQ